MRFRIGPQAFAILAFGLIAAFAVNVRAADPCYSPEEMKAEQLLRLHSELMVITVTCRQSSTGENLVPAYTGFTRKNIGPLHRAEQTLIDYFESRQAGKGVALLDTLRTKLGNEFGQKIATMSAPAFCQRYRDKVTLLSMASPRQIDDEIEATLGSASSYAQLCPAGVNAFDAAPLAKLEH